MKFNTEKTEEVIFSAKRVKPIHPPLSFGDDDVVRKSEHKHLGMFFDSKLDFQSHINEATQQSEAWNWDDTISFQIRFKRCFRSNI